MSTDTHSCANCEGVDPGTCMVRMARAVVVDARAAGIELVCTCDIGHLEPFSDRADGHVLSCWETVEAQLAARSVLMP